MAYDAAAPRAELAGGDRCAALGDKNILFLTNHGVIVAGPTVAGYGDL